MPRFDGFGPRGFGPMTGRGYGYCAGAYPRGRSGFGRGWGYGYGFGPVAPWHRVIAKTEKEFLEEERDLLKARLEEIEEELEEL